MKVAALFLIFTAFASAFSASSPSPDESEIQARSPTVEEQSTPVELEARAVSTKCAAAPRNLSRRSDSCAMEGHLTKGGNPHRTLRGVAYQRCANECTCRPGPAGCQSFSWTPNNRGFGRGRCRLYQQSLDQLPYQPGPAADGRVVNFGNRACYHRTVPTATNTMTQNALVARAAATPAPVARDLLDVEVTNALAGLR